MAQNLVVNVDFEAVGDVDNNVLQIPYDINWVDFELLVRSFYLLKFHPDCRSNSVKSVKI